MYSFGPSIMLCLLYSAMHTEPCPSMLRGLWMPAASKAVASQRHLICSDWLRLDMAGNA